LGGKCRPYLFVVCLERPRDGGNKRTDLTAKVSRSAKVDGDGERRMKPADKRRGDRATKSDGIDETAPSKGVNEVAGETPNSTGDESKRRRIFY